MLRRGVDHRKFLKEGYLENLLSVALPEYAELIQKDGRKTFSVALETLEARLLEELNNMLRGKKTDEETVKRAAEVIKLVEKPCNRPGKAENGNSGPVNISP